MVVVNLLVTLAAWMVGTAVDPVFWILAFAVGFFFPAGDTNEGGAHPGWRIFAAAVFAVLRIIIIPLSEYGSIRVDAPLLAAAIALEFWAAAWCFARAHLAIAWMRRLGARPTS